MVANIRPRARVKALLLGLFVVAGVGLRVWSAVNAPRAEAATSSYLNFQARLLTSTGTVVPDGNYHIEFKIYDTAGSGASAQGVCSLNSSTDDCWWIETRSPGNLVRVVNGYFSVQLGSVTAFGASIPWDQQLWLTMNIGGTSGPTWDGEMLSSGNRVQLTGVPYAFTAGKLQATDSGVTNVLTFATPSGGNKTLTLPNETGTVCTTGSVCTGYQASGNYFLQGGNSFTAAAILGTNDSNSLSFETNNATQLTVAVGGATTFRNSADSAAAFVIQNAAGTATLFGADTQTAKLNLVLSAFSGNLTPSVVAISQSITGADTNNAAPSTNNMAIGIDGNPVIAYEDQTNNDLRVIRCGNNNCSSGNVSTLVDGASTGVGDDAAIAIGPDGYPVIAYYSASGADLNYVKCGSYDCSTNNTITDPLQSTNSVGHDVSIAVAPDGLPIIAHLDGTAGSLELNIVKCGNITCSSGNTTTTDIDTGNVTLATQTSIAIGTDGLPIITYKDDTANDLTVRKCTNATCSTATTTDIATSNDDGGESAIAVGADGLPVIAHRDATNTEIVFVKCTNSSCTSSTSTTVDTSANSGVDLSLVIGTDGYPFMSYQEAGSSDLRVTKCGNPTCTSGNATRTIESTNSTGTNSAVKILPNGLPVIAYFQITDADLAVIRCADTSCSSASGTATTGGIELGSQNTPFQNAYIHNLKLQDSYHPFP